MSQSTTNISLVAAFSAGLLSFVSPCVLIDIGAMPKGSAWIFPEQDGLSIGVAESHGSLVRMSGWANLY